MREPPFVIPVSGDRCFMEDHCANCLEALPEDVEALFCSAWCSEIAESVRYYRRVFRDGRINQADVQEAVRTRNAFLLIGGYRSLGRTLSLRLRAEVKTRDGGLCRICGKPGVEIDHIAGNSSDADNLQLLCADCHHAKTAENLIPARPEQIALLQRLFETRVVPEVPTLLADDEERWPKAWRSLKSARKKRFVDRLIDMGLDIGGLKSRAEMVLALQDFVEDAASELSATEDYDGGFDPDSYFARAMRRDD